jgi:hypothetical protein
MGGKMGKSSNFVSLESLPEIEGSTSVADTYRRLGKAQRGAFSYSENGMHYIVKADDLATQLFEAQDISTLRERAAWSIRDAMRRVKIPVQVAVAERRLSADEDPQTFLQQSSEQAFWVTDGDRRLGWLLTKDALLHTATKRLVYICANNHENPDPDHGTCYKCPAKIVRNELR